MTIEGFHSGENEFVVFWFMTQHNPPKRRRKFTKLYDVTFNYITNIADAALFGTKLSVFRCSFLIYVYVKV